MAQSDIGIVAALAGAAFGGHGSGEGQTQSWFAWAMHLPFGRVLLGLVGVVICGCGLAYLAWGLSPDLERDLSLPPSEKRLFQPVARYDVRAANDIDAGTIGDLTEAELRELGLTLELVEPCPERIGHAPSATVGTAFAGARLETLTHML